MLQPVGHLATKVESWWSLGALVVGTGLFSWLGQHWDALASHGWAAVLIVAVVGASIVAIAVSTAYLAVARFLRRKETESAINTRPAAPDTPRRRPVIIVDRIFMNEKVSLDGYEYIRCTFINCTLNYDSKEDTIIKEPTIKGTLALTSNNLAVDNTVMLLYELGILRIGIAHRERGEYLPPKPKFIGKPHDPEKGPS